MATGTGTCMEFMSGRTNKKTAGEMERQKKITTVAVASVLIRNQLDWISVVFFLKKKEKEEEGGNNTTFQTLISHGTGADTVWQAGGGGITTKGGRR